MALAEGDQFGARLFGCDPWLEPAEYGLFTVAYSVFLLMGTVHSGLMAEPMLAFAPRRFAGDRPHAAIVLSLDWEGWPVKLAVFDPRDERVALKTSLAGRVIERAGPAELRALLDG